MDNDQYQDDLDSISSSSSNVSNASSNNSSDDFIEDATSSPSMSSSLSSSSSSDHINSTTCAGPLYEMASLMQQLPLKRGLSKHFQGKSQSFTSLSNVTCLEDLAKPDHNLYKKKLKSCKSYGGGLSDTSKVSHPKTCSKTISKKASRGSWSSLSIAKRSNSFLGNKPPIPPQRSSSSTLFNQKPLFA
ncbi:oxidative stress [Thalictrum thalictroides]|uniref:Oxidative stress n=1 Tax=Thalictrum thalictroides TaxID=46969 RepID=A0A7J6VLL9_THATH|nr:oxidative stress [Thalictrum thalictroides]